MSKLPTFMGKKSIRKPNHLRALKLTLLFAGCAFLLKSDRSETALHHQIDNK